VVICLERDADLHITQLMPLPLTVSCFSNIQIGIAFLVPAHPGSSGKKTVKRVCLRSPGSLFCYIIKGQQPQKSLDLAAKGDGGANCRGSGFARAGVYQLYHGVQPPNHSSTRTDLNLASWF